MFMIGNVRIKAITKNRFAFFLAPFLSGIILIFAFPPFEQGYLSWIALLPLLWSCLQMRPSRAFWGGFIFGLPLNFYINLYLAKVLYPYLSDFLATLAMILLVIYISMFYALFSLGVSLIYRMGRVWFTALAVPALWILVEYLRSLTFLAYNVGYLGYTQWSYSGLLNIASVYGYWGLPFLIVFFQIILLLSFRKELRGLSDYAVKFVFTAILLVGIALPTFQEVEKTEQPLMVGLIQGNTNPDEIVDYSRDEILDRYLNLTRQAVENEPDLDLVAWPETVVQVNFIENRSHPQAIVQMAEDYDIDLLYGARIRMEGDLYNSIVLFSEGQEEIPVYKKHRLVPFVEFFPAEQLLNQILKLDLLLGSFTAGEELTIFEVGDIPIAGVVCFESYFGDHMRLFTQKGAQHQFIVTNDAWFGESIGLEQHAQASAIRAAETGTGVTQVANSGITISFDYQGRELFRSGKNKQEIFTLPLDMARRETIYTKAGDYFPAFWATFLLLTAPFIYFKTKPGRRPERETKH